MAVTATDAPVGRVTLRIAFMLICPPSFSLGACELMLVFQEHLLAMFPAGFVQHFIQCPALSPPKPVPALLHPPQDSLARVCASAECTQSVCFMTVLVCTVQVIASNIAVSALWPEFAHVPCLVMWHKMKM